MTFLTSAQKASLIEYYDAMGRLAQHNKIRSSPTMKDVISITQYDLYGREPLQYLPYTTAATAQYRADPVAEQLSFYQNTAAVARDTEPFSKIYYDNSPLNEIRKSYGVGWSWHNDPQSLPELSSVKSNIANEVLVIEHVEGSFPRVVDKSYFPANSLSISETRDEKGRITKIYKNYKDQVIFSRTGNGTLWHDSYFVYDTQGNLTCVFPPEGSRRLAEYISSTDKSKFLETWCFIYVYDEFKRTVGKRVPGGAMITMIYDVFDRLVLSQDGNQRLKNQWIFTKYDVFNRPIITGLTSGKESILRSLAKRSTEHHESRQNNSIGYTNLSFPAHSESDVLTVAYYDDYAFLSYTDWDAEKKSYAFVTDAGITDPGKTFLTNVKGYATGHKIRIANENKWLNSVSYYDFQYRAVQSISENHMNGTDRTSTAFHPYYGKPLKTRRTHNTTAATFVSQEEFVYDHAQRLVTVKHSINNKPAILMTSNRYNELGQLIEKNIHSVDEGKTFLQSVDTRYNIHGWLTHMNNSTLTNDGVNNDDTNDLFGFEILFNQTVAIGSPAFSSPKLFDGRMSAVRWKTNIRDPSKISDERIYGFAYDGLSRFLQARYATKSGTTWTGNSGMFDETINHFDQNGNIGAASATVGLIRNGRVSGLKSQIDALTYRYSGNQLRHITDGSPGVMGFVDKTGNPSSVDDYRYDANGNMTEDFNKLITRVEYNHLNLPTEIQITRTDLNPVRTERVLFTYDANGIRLTKRIEISGVIVWKTDYVNGVQYDNERISFANTPEGRAVQVGADKYDYEYFYRDVQRNTRVVYGAANETKRYVATLELPRDIQERTEFGFKNITETRAAECNMTKPDEVVPNPAYSSSCNGFLGKPVGPALVLKVSTGDGVYMEALARYNKVVTTPGVIGASILAAAVTSAFKVTPGENPTLWKEMMAKVPLTLPGMPANPLVPKGYLAFLFFDENDIFQWAGASAITTEAYKATEKLTRSFTANKNGKLFIYVINETNTDPSLNVYFDDVTVVHQKTNVSLQVFQASDYYPYGLRFNDHRSERLFVVNSLNGPEYQPMIHNRYLFQQQELLSDLDLNLYQYKYRMHDPATGRFASIDPLASDYTHNSPYAFSENMVTSGLEVEGLESDLIFRVAKFVSPVAVKLSYAKTTHGSSVGIDLSYGLPQYLPFSYRKSVGVTYHSDHALTGQAFTERRSGKETTLLGFFNVAETNYAGGGIDQTTGKIQLGNPLVNVEHENDWFPDWATSIANPFGIFKPSIGDAGDRFRTAAFQMNVGVATTGFRLGTGEPMTGKVSPIGGLAQTYIPFNSYDPNKFRLGLVYTSFGGLTMGVNSEKNRHQIQNVWVHDSMNPPVPWFQVLPHNEELYLGLNTGGNW